jgi:ribosomal-protein-alanine N-acetyltransferase
MIDTISSEFDLRVCTYDDIPAVMDVNETTLPENYPLFFYEQILEKYPEAFTLAISKKVPGKVIGYIMWRVERGPSSFGLDYVKKGHLVSVAVLELFRRKGIARALMQKSMSAVQNYGVTEYVLEVRVSNSGAVRLYQDAFNFDRIKILHQYYRDGEDAFYMGYRIDLSHPNKPDSAGLTDNDIYRYYLSKDRNYICYRCPNCKRLLLKALNYALPGSIDPQDLHQSECPYCTQVLYLRDISRGLFDIKDKI